MTKGIQLKPELVEFKKYLSIMLPILNRLMDDSDVTIETINENNPVTPNINIVNDVIDNYADNEKYKFINSNDSSPCVTLFGTNDYEDDKKDTVDEVDEIGDKQVEDITNKSLELLNKIKLENWASVIQEDISEEAISSDTDSDEPVDSCLSNSNVNTNTSSEVIENFMDIYS